MEIVIRRPWWKFWRHPMRGLNPWGWQQLKDVNPHVVGHINVDGYSCPNDGGGGLYVFVPQDERGWGPGDAMQRHPR